NWNSWGGGGGWNNWNRPYLNYGGGWNSGVWNWGTAAPAWWATGAYSGWLAGATSSAFVNPYYVAPPAGHTGVYHYSEPVPVYAESPPQQQVIYSETTPAPALPVPTEPQVSETPPEQPKQEDDPKLKQAGQYFETARNSFKAGQYDQALTTVDQAIQLI